MSGETITPAAVRLMLHRCGLGQADAATLLGVQHRQVGRWTRGETYPSGEPIAPRDEHWQILLDLCARQDRAAVEALATIREQAKVHGPPGEVHIRMARTQEDAERLGWPCPGAHVAVIRRVVERAPKGLRIVPVHPGEDEAADMAAARRTAH